MSLHVFVPVVGCLCQVDASLLKWNPEVESHFQFERVGFFVVDKDSVIVDNNNNKYVFNLTVNLKETSKPKSSNSSSSSGEGGEGGGGGGAVTGAGRSRKEEQDKQLADKLVSE